MNTCYENSVICPYCNKETEIAEEALDNLQYDEDQSWDFCIHCEMKFEVQVEITKEYYAYETEQEEVKIENKDIPGQTFFEWDN